MKLAKHLLFMCLIFGVASCGQKSVIKTDVEPRTLAETNSYKVPPGPLPGYTHKKDKNLLWTTTSLPITTDPVDSPVPELGLFGGLVKFIANIGVAMGAGKTEMFFHQPTPPIPEQAKEVRLSRLFFYIEPEANASRRSHWFSRIFRGKGNVDFNFMKNIVLRVKPEIADIRNVCLIPDQGTYQPQFPCKDPEVVRSDEFMRVFREIVPRGEPDLSELEEFVIVKYSGGKNKNKYLMNEHRGAMFMFRTKNPGELYRFVEANPKIKKVITNMMTLDKVVLVELAKDNLAKESFENQLSENARVLDTKVGVEEIEECTPSICLDVRVEEANLLPFLKRLNSNRVEAYIDASRVPETFQLKGFIDIEVGTDLGF